MKVSGRASRGRRLINWADPSPEDIAAGLSDEQRSALIAVRRDRCQPHSETLGAPIPGWREPLMTYRDYGERPILTAAGARVRAVLLASAGEAGTATTTKIGVVHEHAVGAAETPNPHSGSNTP